MEWISNARYGKDPLEGTIFQAKIKEYNLSIHKIRGCGDDYYLSFPDLRINDCNLGTENFEDATKKADDIIKGRLSCIQDAIDSFFSDKTNTISRY